MYVLLILFLGYLITKLAWEAHQIGRQTNDPIWSVQAIALLEPFVSSVLGAGILFGAWRTIPWFALLIIISPLIFGSVVHRRGRHHPIGREIARNMFIRAAIGICAVLYMFLFAIGYLDDQVAQWRWIVCWLVLLLVGFMTLIFIRNQSRAVEWERERIASGYHTQHNRQPLSLPEEDVHNWSAHETILKQLKEEEEKISA